MNRLCSIAVLLSRKWKEMYRFKGGESVLHAAREQPARGIVIAPSERDSMGARRLRRKGSLDNIYGRTVWAVGKGCRHALRANLDLRLTTVGQTKSWYYAQYRGGKCLLCLCPHVPQGEEDWGKTGDWMEHSDI